MHRINWSRSSCHVCVSSCFTYFQLNCCICKQFNACHLCRDCVWVLYNVYQLSDRMPTVPVFRISTRQNMLCTRKYVYMYSVEEETPTKMPPHWHYIWDATHYLLISLVAHDHEPAYFLLLVLMCVRAYDQLLWS